MSYAETLAYIHSVKWQGSKPGLSRTRALLGALGNPERQHQRQGQHRRLYRQLPPGCRLAGRVVHLPLHQSVQ